MQLGDQQAVEAEGRKGIVPTRGALTDGGGVTTYLSAIDIHGKVWTMQAIRRDGSKLFVPDSRKEGTFHVVDGDPRSPVGSLLDVPVLIVAEGYATAVIVAEAARWPVAAAFDAQSAARMRIRSSRPSLNSRGPISAVRSPLARA